MHRIFQAFVDSLAESVDTSDLHDTLARVCDAFDLQCFAYLWMPENPSAQPGVITTYPQDWKSHYLQSRYERIDPVVAQALRDPQPFEWGPEIGPPRISRAQRELFAQAADFGVRYGYTLPIHDGRGGKALVTFAVDELSPPFRRCIDKKAQALQLMSVLFHARARRVMHGDGMVAGISLTPRQLECLEWAARGKSASDIAAILGISPRTATFHIENAKTRLGVRTISQAVALWASSRPSLV